MVLHIQNTINHKAVNCSKDGDNTNKGEWGRLLPRCWRRRPRRQLRHVQEESWCKFHSRHHSQAYHYSCQNERFLLRGEHLDHDSRNGDLRMSSSSWSSSSTSSSPMSSSSKSWHSSPANSGWSPRCSSTSGAFSFSSRDDHQSSWRIFQHRLGRNNSS